MIYTYDSRLLEFAENKIGKMYHYAVYGMGFGLGEFQDMFLKSGVAGQISQGNPWYILNLFGHEIARSVLRQLGWKKMPVAAGQYPPDSAERWAGGVAARLQWQECISFDDLHSLLPMKELASFWPDYMGYGMDFVASDLEKLLVRRGLHEVPTWIAWGESFESMPERRNGKLEEAGLPHPAEA